MSRSQTVTGMAAAGWLAMAASSERKRWATHLFWRTPSNAWAVIGGAAVGAHHARVVARHDLEHLVATVAAADAKHRRIGRDVGHEPGRFAIDAPARVVGVDHRGVPHGGRQTL
ncbi:MAG: hypothetical protein WCK89_20800, partial [bacterium]